MSKKSPFCVLIRYSHLKKRRLSKGEREKLCSGCGEWWPDNSIFYSALTTNGELHLHSRCRLCRSTDAEVRREIKKGIPCSSKPV